MPLRYPARKLDSVMECSKFITLSSDRPGRWPIQTKFVEIAGTRSATGSGQIPLRYPVRELDSIMEFGLNRNQTEILRV